MSVISQNTILSDDIQVMAGVVINSRSKIGKNCIINTGYYRT